MVKSKSFLLIIILGSLAALAPFSIDMYLPGFKSIANDLKTDVHNVSPVSYTHLDVYKRQL